MPLKIRCDHCGGELEIPERQLAAHLANRRRFKKGWPKGRRVWTGHVADDPKCPCRRCASARAWLLERKLRIGPKLREYLMDPAIEMIVGQQPHKRYELTPLMKVILEKLADGAFWGVEPLREAAYEANILVHGKMLSKALNDLELMGKVVPNEGGTWQIA